MTAVRFLDEETKAFCNSMRDPNILIVGEIKIEDILSLNSANIIVLCSDEKYYEELITISDRIMPILFSYNTLEIQFPDNISHLIAKFLLSNILSKEYLIDILIVNVNIHEEKFFLHFHQMISRDLPWILLTLRETAVTEEEEKIIGKTQRIDIFEYIDKITDDHYGGKYSLNDNTTLHFHHYYPIKTNEYKDKNDLIWKFVENEYSLYNEKKGFVQYLIIDENKIFANFSGVFVMGDIEFDKIIWYNNTVWNKI